MHKAPSPLRFAFAGMTAMAAAMGIGRFVYTPLLAGMMDELGLSSADGGLIASSNYLGYLLGAIAAAGGWAQGRERLLMTSALLANALLTAAMGMTDQIGAFLAIRFLAGVASAFVMIFVPTIVFSQLTAAGRDDLQAVHFGGVGVGIALSSALVAVLLHFQAHWQAGWFWSGLIALAGALLVAVLIDRGPARTGPLRAEPVLPRSVALNRVIIAYGLFGFGYIVTATFLVAIVRMGEGGRLFEAWVWLATGLAGIPSVYFWNRLARRYGLARIFAIACLVEATGVVASVAVGGWIGPLLGGVLLGGTLIAITALGLQAGRQLAPAAPRRVFAVMTAAFGVGQILGPLFAGVAADWTGSFFVPSLGAAVALLAAAVMVPKQTASPNLS